MKFIRITILAITLLASVQLTFAASVAKNSEFLENAGRGIRVQSDWCPFGSVNCAKKNSREIGKRYLAGEQGLTQFALRVLGGVLNLAAIAAVIFLIVAGTRLVLAHGDQEEIKASHKHITWTIGGLFIVILSLIIVQNITDVVYESTVDKITRNPLPVPRGVLTDEPQPIRPTTTLEPLVCEAPNKDKVVDLAAAYIAGWEGVVFQTYEAGKDKNGKPIIVSGIGHKEDTVVRNKKKKPKTVAATFSRDMGEYKREAISFVGDVFYGLDPVRQVVLMDMAFNTGGNLRKFTKLKEAVRKGKYGDAAKEILLGTDLHNPSKYYRDSPGYDSNILKKIQRGESLTLTDTRNGKDIFVREVFNAYLMQSGDLNALNEQIAIKAKIQKTQLSHLAYDGGETVFQFLCANVSVSATEAEIVTPGVGEINWNNRNAKVSKYFNVGEVTQGGDIRRIPTSSMKERNIIKLALELDKIRKAWGGAIEVNSWYRPPAVNREEGGAPKSQHLSGLAADIRPTDGKITKFQDFLIRHWTGGFGRGAANRGFVHVDLRDDGKYVENGDGKPSTVWTYPPK